jgi:hypothetical protein
MIDFSGTALIDSTVRRSDARDDLCVVTELDKFVAFNFLSVEQAAAIRGRWRSSAGIGCLLPAENFDPPEDHAGETEFEYADILVNDFSDVNDDVGTLYGVRSGHFRCLLDWQPKVNSEVTRLMAIVAPGDWYRTEVKEARAIRELSTALAGRGYDAIALRCKAGDDAEFRLCVDLAAAMHEWTALPIAHLAQSPRDIRNSPFCMTIRQPL